MPDYRGCMGTAEALLDGGTILAFAILASAPALHEPVAWGGPIVMNTREELQHAFDELQAGTFIK